jgi:hypothetical protein
MQASPVARFCEAKCKRVLLPAFLRSKMQAGLLPAFLRSKMQAGSVARFCEATPEPAILPIRGLFFIFL